MTAPARPAPTTPREYHFPRFERRVLSNGLRLVIAPARRLPVVTVIAVIDAGAEHDPTGKEGLARMTAALLTEGIPDLDGAALTEKFERLGTGLDAHADWDAATARLTLLPERLAPALELFGRVLASPTFPERELERYRAERLADLLQLRSEPGGLADEAFSRAVYDASARYSALMGGGDASVRALTRDDVVHFYGRHYRPDRTTLVIAGDIDADQVTHLAEGILGGWSAQGDAGTPSLERAIDTTASATRRTWFVAKPDAAQSEIRIGHIGVARSHEDFLHIAVMNAILGGLFSSRINLNLRERHGYTYGAHSEFDWRRGAGPFLVASAVQSESTAAAAREVLLEIDRMRAEPVKDEELSLATSYLDGVFPLRYESTDAIAGALANLVIYGLPDDYYDSYRPRVRAVTVADVHRAAERHLKPEHLQVIAVGDPGVVQVGMSEFASGALEVWDTEGKRVS